MNAEAVMHYGHETLLATAKPVSMEVWEQPGVCGDWSLKQLIAHLASFEWVLVEVLTGFLKQAPTPLLDRFSTDGDNFNEDEVTHRSQATPEHVLADYQAAHVQTSHLLSQIPVEMRQQLGTLPWYGNAYALDDFIVYAFYGHKREHSAQIAIFAEKVNRGQAISAR